MLKKINRTKVSLPKDVNCQFDPKKVRGAALFCEPYCNVFICAKKKSGKSTVIYNIIQKTIDKDTKVYVFCSTVKKDPSWRATIQYLDDHSIYYETFQSIKDGKQDNLDEIVKELQNGADEEEDTVKHDDLKLLPKTIMDDDSTDEKTAKKKRKKAKIACENLFIFDDISAELKNSKSLTSLLKQNRHTKSKVIISSQYYLDLKPEQRSQIDYHLIFPAIREDKLKGIYQDSDLNVNYDQFLQLYHTATEEKYNFLYIDVRESKFRKNFNMEFQT